MTATELIDIFQWRAIWYASPAAHEAARLRFDALTRRRIKERIER